MTPFKIVAFDCDGVLFDTVNANKAYYNAVLEHLGRPAMTEDQFHFAHMHTVDETMAFLFSDDAASLDAAQAYRRRLGYQRFVHYMQMEPYLKTLLTQLRPHFKTAIVTNRTDSMGFVMAAHGLDGCFDLVVTALDVVKPKPHPHALLKVLAHFNAQRHEMLYIGDSEVDEMAAKAAGVFLAAFRNPLLDAQYHLNSFEELEMILLPPAGKLK